MGENVSFISHHRNDDTGLNIAESSSLSSSHESPLPALLPFARPLTVQTTDMFSEGATSLKPLSPRQETAIDRVRSEDNNSYKLNLRVFAAGGGKHESFDVNKKSNGGEAGHEQQELNDDAFSDVSDISDLTFSTKTDQKTNSAFSF